jgi:hypothetical protein
MLYPLLITGLFKLPKCCDAFKFSRQTYETRLLYPFQEAFPPPAHHHPSRMVIHKPDLPFTPDAQVRVGHKVHRLIGLGLTQSHRQARPALDLNAQVRVRHKGHRLIGFQFDAVIHKPDLTLTLDAHLDAQVRVGHKIHRLIGLGQTQSHPQARPALDLNAQVRVRYKGHRLIGLSLTQSHP